MRRRMTTEISYFDQLRNELVTAADRHSKRSKKRRQRLTKLSLVILVLFMTTVMTMQLSETPSNAAVLQVIEESDGVVIRIADLSATSQQVEAELRDAGIDADVKSVPVSRSGIGRFVFADEKNVQYVSAVLNGGGLFFEGFRAKRDSGAVLHLWIGREANNDERYVKAINAYLPGGLLECSDVWGKRLEDVLSNLHERATRITWQRRTSEGFAPAVENEVLNMHIADALEIGPNELIIYLTDAAGSPLFGGSVPEASSCTR